MHNILSFVMHRVCMLKITVGLEASHCSNIVHSSKKCKASMNKVAGACKGTKKHVKPPLIQVSMGGS